jgi:UPF0716 family protein affecting phage T7 exclusion
VHVSTYTYRKENPRVTAHRSCQLRARRMGALYLVVVAVVVVAALVLLVAGLVTDVAASVEGLGQ